MGEQVALAEALLVSDFNLQTLTDARQMPPQLGSRNHVARTKALNIDLKHAGSFLEALRPGVKAAALPIGASWARLQVLVAPCLQAACAWC
jgi:hypothetical protein